MTWSDIFDFTLDEETEKRLYDLMTDIDTRNTNRFWIKDKRGYHAEYVKVIRCKDCVKYKMFGDSYCPWIEQEVEEDFFCADGTRKEE